MTRGFRGRILIFGTEMEQEVLLLDARLAQNSSRSYPAPPYPPPHEIMDTESQYYFFYSHESRGIRGGMITHDDFCFGTGCKILGRCDFGRKVTHAPWAMTKVAFFCLSPCAWSDAEMTSTQQNFQLFQMSAFAVIVCRHRLQSLSKQGL